MKFKNKGIAGKKKKFWTTTNIMVVVIIAIMVFSVGAVMLWGGSSDNGQYKYNGFNFRSLDNKWVAKINSSYISFDYLPVYVESINASADAVGMIKNAKMLYLVFNPKRPDLDSVDSVRLELTNDFADYLGIYVASGITEQSSFYNLSVLSCSNSTALVPVVFLKESDSTQLTLENNCIVFEASSINNLYLKDRLKYGVFGVIK